MTNYVADDSDLPPEIFKEAHPNRVREAEAAILRVSGAMGIVLTFSEVHRFALILVGLADDEEIKFKGGRDGERKTNI